MTMTSVGSLIAQGPFSPGQKALGHALRLSEGSMGLSHTVAAQHILMSWLPKAAFSRSKAEIVELTILDVIETFLVYYAIPLTAGKIFFPLLTKFHKNDLGKGMSELKKPVTVLMKEYQHKNPEMLRKLLTTKAAAVLMGMVAGGAVWEYALTFFKNAITLKAFNKESFSSVANLSDDPAEATTTNQRSRAEEEADDKALALKHENSQVMKRARQRIGVSLGIGAAVVVLGSLLGTLGHQSKAIQPAVREFLKIFDFSYKQNPKTGKYIVGLSDNLNRFFIANAFIAYIDSARDSLERFEIISRLSIVLSYLAFGNGIVSRFAVKGYETKMPELFKQKLDEFDKPVFNKKGEAVKVVKELEDFIKEIKIGHPHLPETEIHALAKAKFAKILPKKLRIFFIPQLIGVSIAGFANAGVNRVWTAYRYKQSQKEAQAKAHYMPANLSLHISNRGFDGYLYRINQRLSQRA